MDIVDKVKQTLTSSLSSSIEIDVFGIRHFWFIIPPYNNLNDAIYNARINGVFDYHFTKKNNEGLGACKKALIAYRFLMTLQGHREEVSIRCYSPFLFSGITISYNNRRSTIKSEYASNTKDDAYFIKDTKGMLLFGFFEHALKDIGSYHLHKHPDDFVAPLVDLSIENGETILPDWLYGLKNHKVFQESLDGLYFREIINDWHL